MGMYHFSTGYSSNSRVKPELLEETTTSTSLQAISAAVPVIKAFGAARWRWRFSTIVDLREHTDPPIATFCVESPMGEKNHGKIVLWMA